MWMMGYNDVRELNIPDSFNGRKLRPLIPRPIPPLCTTSATSTAPTLSHTHCNDLFPQYHHPATVSDQSKREFNNTTQLVMASSRWNPTPEQLMALEELYREGTRTPSAEQIQHITSQLRRYGKIEGKNVFYWFQNHKARERQKRRRQMESVTKDPPGDNEILERKDTAGRTGYEVEEAKNWALSTNCSKFSEESVSVQLRAAKATVAERNRVERWIQIDEGELQQSRNFVERNSTWQMMQLPFPIQSNQLINTSSRTTTAAVKTTLMDPKFIKTHDLNSLMEPYRDQNYCHRDHLINTNIVINEEDEITEESAETLQLFPLGRSLTRNEKNGGEYRDSDQISVSSMNDTFSTPNYQFFEFLPPKNQVD